MIGVLRVVAFHTLLAATPVVSVDVPVPGGTAAVADAVGLRSVPDPARLVAELTRAVYADASVSNTPDSRYLRLVAHLELTRRDASRSNRTPDLVPIPLTPAVWSDAVFHRPVAATELFAAAACDRNAALLAYGLAALDDETLQFLVDHPSVVTRIYEHDAAVFAAFAEHLHIHFGRIDGEDRGSHIGVDEVERALQASDLTLYMIGQGRGVTNEALKKVMQRLSRPTGGRALFTESINELHHAFDELLDELSNQYVLGYQPANALRDGTWRQIAVGVDGQTRVRARHGHRALGR